MVLIRLSIALFVSYPVFNTDPIHYSTVDHILKQYSVLKNNSAVKSSVRAVQWRGAARVRQH